MKAPPFRYHAPRSKREALEMLESLPNSRVLAGGQSLLPNPVALGELPVPPVPMPGETRLDRTFNEGW